jgi:NAD(P)-dependent dehydrogenase (short-subunit alcohol dehydrogenase family)
MTRVIAAELLDAGIRVNAVAPGPIKTPILARRMDERTLKQTYDYLTSTVPMKRMGDSEEVAEAVLFLSSKASSFTTGSELSVDGGFMDLT